MKKQFISVAIIGLSLVSLVSCTKEENVAAPLQKVDVNRVVFESVEEYENLFADPNTTEEKVNKVAARFGTFNEAARVGTMLEDTLYPEFLQKILNDDKVVQIDKWLIKVDAAKEKVFVLDKKYLDQYNDLANENLENKNLMIFSTDDDVLEILQTDVSTSNTRIEGLFCSDKAADSKEDKEIIIYPVYSTDGTIFMRQKVNSLKYITRGIYFDIHANFVVRDQESNGLYKNNDSYMKNYPPFINMVFNTNYKLRCGKNDYVSAKVLDWNVGLWEGELRRNIYFNIKPLTKYDSYVQIGGGKLLNIKHGY